MSFFCFRTSFVISCRSCLLCLLSLLLFVVILQTSLVFYDFDIFESISQVFCRTPLNLRFSEALLRLRLCIIGDNKKCCWATLSIISVQFSSVAQLYLTLCDPMNHSTPGLPVRHQLPEFTQTPVHWVSDAIQPSHPLSSPSSPALNLSQHQGLFKWVSSSHQVAKVLEFQLEHQSFQWTPRTDLL